MAPFNHTWMLLSCSIVAVCNAASTCKAASTQKLDLVRYGSFTQTATYSIANQLGFFTAYGLDVQYLQTSNSTYAYNTTLSGGYDIFTGAIDNCINLRFNQGRNVTVLGQLDGGADQVIASVPSVKTIADLKGKSLMVDSPVSGFAYALRKVLSLYGLELGTDYTFVVSTTLISGEVTSNEQTDRGRHEFAIRRLGQWHLQRERRIRKHSSVPLHSLRRSTARRQSPEHPSPHLRFRRAIHLRRLHHRRSLIE